MSPPIRPHNPALLPRLGGGCGAPGQLSGFRVRQSALPESAAERVLVSGGWGAGELVPEDPHESGFRLLPQIGKGPKPPPTAVPTVFRSGAALLLRNIDLVMKNLINLRSPEMSPGRGKNFPTPTPTPPPHR